MIRKRFLWAILGLSLCAACSKKTQSGTDAAPFNAAGMTTAASVTVDAAAEAADAGRAFELVGLGPIKEGAVLSVASLQEAFPGFVVSESKKSFDEGNSETTVFAVAHTGRPVYSFNVAEGGTITSARILHSDVVIPGTELRVGATLPSPLPALDCVCVGEDGSDGFVCALKDNRFAIVLETKDGDCALDNPAPEAALRGRAISGFAWSAEPADRE